MNIRVNAAVERRDLSCPEFCLERPQCFASCETEDKIKPTKSSRMNVRHGLFIADTGNRDWSIQIVEHPQGGRRPNQFGSGNSIRTIRCGDGYVCLTDVALSGRSDIL